MRKLMLGAVLLAAMLPVTTVYAAGEGTAKKNYTSNKTSKAAKKNAEDAIAEGVKNGLTVLEAMTEILEADLDNVTAVVAAAVKADPTNAGPITKLAIVKAPLQANAITSAALRAATTPDARTAVATAAKDEGVPASTVNALVADIAKPSKPSTAPEEFTGVTTTPSTTPPIPTTTTASGGGVSKS